MYTYIYTEVNIYICIYYIYRNTYAYTYIDIYKHMKICIDLHMYTNTSMHR